MKRFLCVYLAILMLLSGVLSTAMVLQPQMARADDTNNQLPDDQIGAADTSPDGTIADDSSTSDTDETYLTDDTEIPDGEADPSLTDNAYYLASKIEWMSDSQVAKTPYAVGPSTDVTKLAGYEIDNNVTDYLLNLIEPPALGGQGINHIKVARLETSYTSNGAGKNDRENAGSVAADPEQQTSAHHDGRAVDISEVGAVTCKLVSKSYLGGDSTSWLAPQAVKVAWQSNEGITNNPTPTGQSAMEAAGLNSAQGIVNYLNGTGQLDAYVSFVKGLNLQQIITYVGANIYMKNFATSSIVSDPLADSLIHVVGGAALEKALPGLPEGMAIGNNDEDARIAFAKSELEKGLNLPSGSLRGYGWDGILTSVGKRNIENALGLPALYLENHSLQDLNSNQVAAAALKNFQLNDSSFNVPAGTISLIQANNTRGLEQAGVNILASALKLSSVQQTALLSAVQNKTTPNVVLSTSPVGDKIGVTDLENMFSADPAKQQQAADALKQKGLDIVKAAVSSATSTKYAGLTSQLLNILTDGNSTIKLGDLKQTVGTNQIGATAGLDPSQYGSLTKTDQVNQLFATAINESLDLTGSSQISAGDVKNIGSTTNTDIFNKIGGMEIDRAMGWNNGTGLKILQGTTNLSDAFTQIASNSVSQLLGLKVQGISLDGNVSNNFANAIVNTRLGLDSGTFDDQASDSTALSNKIGTNKFNQIFGLPSNSTIDQLRSNASFWSDQTNVNRWQATDINVGLPIGTTQQYLQGSITSDQYRRDAATTNATNLTVDKLWNQFGLQDALKIDSKSALAIINVIKGGDNVTLQDQQAALKSLYTILGRTLDQGSGFAADSLIQYFTAGDASTQTSVLIGQGLRLFAKQLGLSDLSGGQTDATYTYLGNLIYRIFNEPDHISVPGNPSDRAILASLVAKATGIPIDKYPIDVGAFGQGDFRTGYAAVTFSMWGKQINQYLPANDQLSYGDLRDTLIVDENDPRVIQDVGDTYYPGVPLSAVTSLDPTTYSFLAEPIRKQFMEDAQKSSEYKISDSFLRKADSTIPAGFTRAMLEGSDTDRTQALMGWGFGNIEIQLKRIEPGYVPGTLMKIFNGTLSSNDADVLVGSIIARSGVSFGPFTTAFMQNFYQFLKSDNKADFMTNGQYAGMWSFFDGWAAQNLGIGALPAGLTKAIFLSAQNNWSMDTQLKDASGKVIVPSLKSYGEAVLVSQLTQWADNVFHFPVGRTYQLYQAYTAYSGALKVYAAASNASAAVKATAASKLSAASNAMWALAIQTALQLCDACQAFFASVDKAIAAPPGFTNMAVAGAISMALGLGPWGLVAAGIYFLFGAYTTEYLCPKPPIDPYAVTGDDPPADQVDYSKPTADYYYIPTDSSAQVKYAPAPGTTYFNYYSENPFDWQKDVQFGNGEDKLLWMGWARYFTGELIQDTLDYGANQRDIMTNDPADASSLPSNKLLQIITYRKANADYFAPQSDAVYGDKELNSPYIGTFYTQDSTKTTDWVHVGFGGII
ncbi:MAG TPA: hypothetical protein VMQ44_03550 [Candidatus Saccharimonadales bacterium]|nr:hypothetical protein [Candidatus Saccharimonadales bacterium]